MRGRALALVLLHAVTVLAIAASSKDRISLIEFYGYEGIDLPKVKRAIHVKPGQKATELTIEVVEENVRKALGVDATDVAMVCCDNSGGFVVYIGLPGKSVREATYNELPTEDVRLPEELLDLVEKVDEAVQAAANRGGAGAQEDDTAGYALLGDPAVRTLQLQLRDAASKSEAGILLVLRGSAKEDQRAAAALALGYAARSLRQIAALVEACRDSSDAVRNNAARALGVLLRSTQEISKEAAKSIPAAPFVDLLSSPVWTDRNKASLILLELTRTRDAGILRDLRSRALTALIEMAQWRDEKHAYFARVLLGRVAGLPEAQIVEMANNKRTIEIIHAAGRP